MHRFIISSWLFDWEGAAFGAAAEGGAGTATAAGGRPCAFDHGALVPVVAVFTKRPQGGGVNVYASGPKASLEGFMRDLAAASEWEALLADLSEMGFADVEKNKVLMLKHAGNIKRTVKELVEDA